MDSPPSPTFSQLLGEELGRRPVTRVLLVGMAWPALPRPQDLQEVSQLSGLRSMPERASRADLAVLVHPDHGLDPELALQAGFAGGLAALRDLYAARVLLATPLATAAPAQQAQREALRAMGYTELGISLLHGQRMLTHRFDLLEYKPTPTWLNSQGWANPEQWNKHRW